MPNYINLPADKYGNLSFGPPRVVEAIEEDGFLYTVGTPEFPWSILATWQWKEVNHEPGEISEEEYLEIILSLDVPEYMKDAIKERNGQ